MNPVHDNGNYLAMVEEEKKENLKKKIRPF
jgi:hypothetical protein